MVVTNKNKLINAGSTPTNSLTGTINLKNGFVQIVFGNGDRKATTKGFGAVLQNTNYVGGYFVTKTNAGSISLSDSGQALSSPPSSEQQGAENGVSNGSNTGSNPVTPPVTQPVGAGDE